MQDLVYQITDIYRQQISYWEKGNILFTLTWTVKGRERARMRSEAARLKMKMLRADLILSLMTAIRTRTLLRTKIIKLLPGNNHYINSWKLSNSSQEKCKGASSDQKPYLLAEEP